MGTMIDIAVPDGTFHAYLASSGAQAPTVVVLHEAFGVNRDIRATCDELARQGFNALSPDLYWRQEPDLDLSPQVEWARGIALYEAMSIDKAVMDAQATIEHARGLAQGTRRVGVMGYCLGGLLAYLCAVRGGVEAGVCFHGGKTEQYLDEASALRGHLQMHVGSLDEFITPVAQAAIHSALARLGVEIHTYPGCYHAFARHQGTRYDAKAAAKAMTRTFDFLRAHLG